MTDMATGINSASPGDDSRVKRKAATPVVNAIFIDTQPGIALGYVTIKLTENGITKTLFYGDAWVLRKSIARYLSRGFAVVDKSENVAVHEMIRGLRSASVVKPAQHELPSVYRPKVSLIWATPNGDQLVADMARVSVLDSEGKPPESLINYMVTHQHWSPLEMVSMCVEIEAPRDITRQILRHRSFSYQEKCIAGDSRVSVMIGGAKVRRTIADLYARQESGDYNGRRGVVLARMFDEGTKTLSYAPIKEVFKAGVKPVYEVSVGNGKQRVIKSTAEHKFLCRDGTFRQLADIAVGDFVALNGTEVLYSPEWLADAKTRSIESGSGVRGIADEAGCSYHSVRKWLKKHGMQFTRMEAAACTTIWNEGLPTEQQPAYGYKRTEETRKRMRDASRKGSDSSLYTTGASSNRTWRNVVQDECLKWKGALLRQQADACDHCGAPVCIGDGSEIDHKQPICFYPEKAFDLDNLHVLCKACHTDKTNRENKRTKQTVHWGRVTSITFFGNVETYDMEVDHPSHNYVAEGIVVHNSARYSTYDAARESVLRECRLKHPTNRQMSVKTDDYAIKAQWDQLQGQVHEVCWDAYRDALRLGVAKEQARTLLPEGQVLSRMFMTGTVRSWVHYTQVRHDPNAVQGEHVLVAREVERILAEQFPIIYAATKGTKPAAPTQPKQENPTDD